MPTKMSLNILGIAVPGTVEDMVQQHLTNLPPALAKAGGKRIAVSVNSYEAKLKSSPTPVTSFATVSGMAGERIRL
jgi:hypothetical protein